MAIILSARHMKSPVLCTMDRDTGFRIIRPQILNGKKSTGDFLENAWLHNILHINSLPHTKVGGLFFKKKIIYAMKMFIFSA